MTWEQGVLVAQLAASSIMCGIIWFVQIIHYPLLSAVPGEAGAAYALLNRRRTAWVVLPPMIVEAATAAWCVYAPPAGVSRPLAGVGVGLVAAVWLSTLAVQMPLHERLGREGCRADLVTRLVASNWPRTILWTARLAVAAWMVSVACGP